MPRPTINDVAAHAGVSKKTVSFVLNRRDGIAPPTRARVEAAIAALGYCPSAQARALARGLDATLVMAISPGESAAVADALRGALRAIAGTGLVLIVAEGADGLASVLAHRRPRGVIALGGLQISDGTPVISITADGTQAAADAARYLMALGHRRIAIAAGPDGDDLALRHERGLADAIGSATLLVANGDGGIASGREAACALLDLSPAPTAILAANAEMALGVLQTAQRRGLAVPASLSVISLEDGPLAELGDPPITAMRHDWAASAFAAARCAIASSPPGQSLAQPAMLIPRATTAPPGG